VLVRAREEWTDEVTGARVRPGTRGAAATGSLVAAVKTKRGRVAVPVELEDVAPASKTWKVEPAAEPSIRREAEAIAKRKPPAKAKRIGDTFASAAKAADEFADNNDFFSEAAEADPHDYVREWMDGQESRSGKRYVRLAKSKRGAELLAMFQRTPDAAIRATLAFLFGRAKGRRWSAVPWSAVDSFVEALRLAWDDARERRAVGSDAWRSGGVLRWYPPGAAKLVQPAELRDLSEGEAREQARLLNQSQLAGDIERLRDALKAARPCLSAEERKLWSRRVRELEQLAKTPEQLERHALCEPEGLGYVCGYPVLWSHTSRLRSLCSREDAPVSDDLDLPWERNPGTPRTPLRGVLMRKGPINLAGADLVDLLGTLDELALTTGAVVRWARRPAAYWHAETRSFVAIEGAARPRMQRFPTTGKTADAFERWTGREQQRVGALDLKVRERWIRIAKVERLDYTSRKWSRHGTAYTHDTTTRPTLYRMGGDRPPWIWVVRGSGFTLTTRGLIG